MALTFQSNFDEYLYSGAFESGVIRGAGASDGPLGYFAAVTLVDGFGDDEAAAIAHYGSPFLILVEKDDVVMVNVYPTREKRDRRVLEMEQAVRMHEAGVSDKDMAEAITGYRRALEWDAGHDGKGLSWTVEAQERTNDDVTEFVLRNIDDLRTYMQVTGQEWQAVGGDFAFSRLESDAARMGGFERLAEGETVDDLVADATRMGKVLVLINEEQEMEVHPA
jgi:hypothetical protein